MLANNGTKKILSRLFFKVALPPQGNYFFDAQFASRKKRAIDCFIVPLGLGLIELHAVFVWYILKYSSKCLLSVVYAIAYIIVV